MIKAVLFDLDGTLLDRNGSLDAFLPGQYARFAAEPDNDADCAAFCKRFIDLDGYGYTPKTDLYQTLAAEFFSKSPHPLSPAPQAGEGNSLAEALAADFQDRFRDSAVMFPNTAEMLAVLRASGFPLGIVTNGSTDAQSGKIVACKLGGFVDTILISEQEGVRKPDPEIYIRAAQRLAVEPSECLFVGDNPRLDVSGSQAVGMTGVWLRGHLPWPDDLTRPPDYTIEKIEEVSRIVCATPPP
jgi:putative hydrolase of the HAD superfamily